MAAVLERAKRVHASDRVAIVIGSGEHKVMKLGFDAKILRTCYISIPILNVNEERNAVYCHPAAPHQSAYDRSTAYFNCN
jgi:hypothetical protein